MFSVLSQPARRDRHTVTAERPLCSINLSKASGGSESIEGMLAWLFMPLLGMSTYREFRRGPSELFLFAGSGFISRRTRDRSRRFESKRRSGLSLKLFHARE